MQVVTTTAAAAAATAARRRESKKRRSCNLETSSLLNDDDDEDEDDVDEEAPSSEASRDTIISFHTTAKDEHHQGYRSKNAMLVNGGGGGGKLLTNGQRRSRNIAAAGMGQYDYPKVSDNDSLRVDVQQCPSTKRPSTAVVPPHLMRLSASSPSGFELERRRKRGGAGGAFASVKTLENGHYSEDEDDEEDPERWLLLDHTSQRESSDDCWTLWQSRPSSSNQIFQGRSVERLRVPPPSRLVNRAESESLLIHHHRPVFGSRTMAAAMSSPDTALERHASASSTGTGGAGGGYNRSSVRYGRRSAANMDTIPRRHSGASSARHSVTTMTRSGGGGQMPLQPRLSQGPPQPKASTCSLMMVSPTSVSRSPSQQWLRSSTGSCVATMPSTTTTNTVVSPSMAQPTNTNPFIQSPNSTQPSQPDPNSLAVVDHRNAFTPIPGAVTGGGGLQNPLYNVSNEFMRVAGYSQQFKSLLSKRDGSMKKPSQDLPGVTFAENGKDKDLEKGSLALPLGSSVDSSSDAALAAAGVTLSGVAASPATASDATKDSGNGPDPRMLDPKRPTRKSAYGRLWKEQPNLKHRLKKRKTLFSHRTKVSDFALLFAVVGILLTILEAELTASAVVAKTDYSSLLLRSLIVVTSVVLMALVVWYHAIETKIAVIDSGAEDWRVAITYDRLWQCALEVAVCSVCPFPANFNVTWDRLKADHRTPYSVAVPLDAVLSVPMFLRTYLFGRFMALHSRQFQDAATRSIAALNHIAVNFTFVLKTLMHEHPLRVLILFTVAFWVAMSWILTQCERYASSKPDQDLDQTENNHYLNSIWFIIITFMSIGYGDIVPNTYCGRALAITTGIVGAGVSSALIAVISRKLELSRAEKHVNQFMTDSKLTRQRKEAAASVLQHTWFIHKYKNIPKAKDDMKLRMHQRRFLAAINEFRRVKWDQRKLAEQGNALVDVAKLQSDMHETLWDMQQNQDHLVAQMGALMQKMQELQDIIVAQSQPHTTRPGSMGVMTRQFSVHPASPTEPTTQQFTAPIVIAQHVAENGDASGGCSMDDENGKSVML